MKRKLLILFLALLSLRSNAAENVIKIVVLGSSTAAGTGANPSSLAWVPKYATYLKNINQNNEVINLARGGYSTYHIMPNGNSVPNRPSPDTERNITKALSYNPDVIIINMPSNDVAAGYAVNEVIANYAALKSEAGNIPVYFTTTQPRNLSSASSRQMQIDIKNATIQTYPNNYIDFWTDIAESDGTIKPAYDSGDGIHLNNAGHEILYNRVVGVSSILTYAKPYSPSVYSTIGKILIDFGPGTSSMISTANDNWNNITSATSTTALTLKNKAGEITPFEINIHAPFATYNTNGTKTSTVYPANATTDSFYGYTTGTFQTFPRYEKSGVTLSNLDTDKYYSFTFYAGRIDNAATDNRETKYIIKGKTEKVAVLNVINNVNNTVSVENIEPDNEGKIVIEVTAGDNNTHPNKFYYLGILDVAYKPTTTPVTLVNYELIKNKDYVHLNWATSSENINSHFEIYRAGSDKKFTQLFTIPASSYLGYNNYSYKDYNPLTGVNYYFLRQVDLDGVYKDYAIKSATFSLNKDKAISAYVSESNIVIHTYSENDREQAQLNIFNTEGRLLINKEVSLKKGDNEIDAGRIGSSGVYIVILKKESQTLSCKVLTKL